MNTEYTRPFNMEHAKAGAPYRCRNGMEATVLKWDARNAAWPLVGIAGASDAPRVWKADGTGTGYEVESDLVMVPVGTCEGKPVFYGDELEDQNGVGYTFLGPSSSCRNILYNSRWPTPYPKTKLDVFELSRIYSNTGASTVGLVAVANAVIRHAIESGQVCLPPDGSIYNDAMRWRAVVDLIKPIPGYSTDYSVRLPIGLLGLEAGKFEKAIDLLVMERAIKKGLK